MHFSLRQMDIPLVGYDKYSSMNLLHSVEGVEKKNEGFEDLFQRSNILRSIDEDLHVMLQ